MAIVQGQNQAGNIQQALTRVMNEIQTNGATPESLAKFQQLQQQLQAIRSEGNNNGGNPQGPGFNSGGDPRLAAARNLLSSIPEMIRASNPGPESMQQAAATGMGRAGDAGEMALQAASDNPDLTSEANDIAARANAIFAEMKTLLEATFAEQKDDKEKTKKGHDHAKPA